MTYHLLPTTDAPRHVFVLDIAPDGVAMRAKVELRYLPAPDHWVVSIWDYAKDLLLINQIPLICSYEAVNDLLEPFRYLRNGDGLGSLFVLKNTDQPSTPDPSENNLNQFLILWGDTFNINQLIIDNCKSIDN